MAKSKFKRKGKSKFIMLEAYLLRSDAWRSLTPNDRALYLEFKWRYDGLNNGRIGFSARDAATALGVSQMTAIRSMNNLQDRGFVIKTKLSGFNMKSRVATEWRLSEYQCDVSGHVASRDFMKWAPGEKSTASPGERTASPRKQSGPYWEAKHA